MPRLSAAAALVVLIAAAFYMSIRSLERSPPVQPEYQGKPKKDSSSATLADSSTQPDPDFSGISRLEEKRSLIETAVRGFFQAASVNDKLAFARDVGRVRPLMQAYYTKKTLQTRTVAGLGSCVSIGEKGQRLGYIEALFTSGKPAKVIVEEGPDGRFRVDWESLVKYSEMEWADFLSRKPTSPTLFRVLVSRLPTTGSDRQVWLEISYPGNDKRLKAGLNPHDPAFQPLLEQLEMGDWKNVPLTLRLCYSEAKSNAESVLITGSEGKGWLILTDRRS
ncbi:hypothetical protein WJU23_19345 [Prosthecobacter sp. SYSU 5D2]|uniref:hypothetical protein n=1 Tax=Prosthecobacter sp. SYSU 5D2 TaxID=3134134 RepID=UPI0031FED85B